MFERRQGMNAVRWLASLIVLLALTLVAVPQSLAQEKYPSRPVRILVGYSPGTTSDIFARMVAEALAKRWRQTVFVENRDGAGGAIAADMLARSAPDGYTLMLTSNAFILGPLLQKSLPYDPFTDFFAITQIAQTPNIFLVGKGLGVANLGEYIALAKKGKLQYASSGRGTPSHITVELFKSMAGVQIEEIPYKSSGQALTDTMSGVVSLNAPGLAQGLAQVNGGRVVALGITGSKRSPGAPDIPTLAEQGVPGYEAYGWHGLFAPAKTPPDVTAFLDREMVAILTAPDLRAKFLAQGGEVVASAPYQFQGFLRRDFAKWQKLFGELGIKPE